MPDINALATITALVVGIGVTIAGIVLNQGDRRLRDKQMEYRNDA